MIRNGLMLRRMIRSSSTGMLFGRWNGFEIENRKINLRSFNYLVLFSWGGGGEIYLKENNHLSTYTLLVFSNFWNSIWYNKCITG
jgi:hypothetical protein